MRCHLTLIKRTLIKNNNNNKQMLVRSEEIGLLVHCQWEGKCAATVENSNPSLQKKHIKLPDDPVDSVVPLLGVFPKERKAGVQTDICTLMFIAVSLTTTTQERPTCSGGYVHKPGVTLTCTGTSCGHRKEWGSGTRCTMGGP